MAELADASDSKSDDFTVVRVRPPLRVLIKKAGQHQSQWILMKDAALDKDPQSIIFKVFIAVG